tara:strand:+ start:1300 stop:1479 length:180 start_codon:yes stop_codon:yes gene_type:complete
VKEYKMEKDELIKELSLLGLHKKLLKVLDKELLLKIHELIGWAVPVFKPTKNLEEGAEA